MRMTLRAVSVVAVAAALGIAVTRHSGVKMREVNAHPSIARAADGVLSLNQRLAGAEAGLPAEDRIAELNHLIAAGSARVAFDGARDGLRSVLVALGIPIESQVLVYSKTSRQRDRIDAASPRAIYFDGTTLVGFVPGGELEVITHEAARGVAFYTLGRSAGAPSRFASGDLCIECHGLPESGGTPGLLFKSQVPGPKGASGYPPEWPVDDRTAYPDRWGGWYVTGLQVPPGHRGNGPLLALAARRRGPSVEQTPASVAGVVDAGRYLSPYSDVVALLVLGHQVAMTNLLARLGVEARRAARDAGGGAGLDPLIRAVVDGLLFVGEAPLPGPVRGSSGFDAVFAAKGPRDGRGRSLRDFDLRHGRVFRYPCSYLIYSPAFEDLPEAARAGVYTRLWEVLSGRDSGASYAHLSAADRLAIVDILRATKKDLPAYFRQAR